MFSLSSIAYSLRRGYANHLVYIFFCVSAFTPSCTPSESTQTQTQTQRPIPSIDLSPDPTCRGLFGQPNDHSGVDESGCAETCECASGSSSYTALPLDHPMFQWIYENPPSSLLEDPYAESETEASDQRSEVACVITPNPEGGRYRLDTLSLSRADPHQVTHTGPCGACSSLQDLAVYAGQIDLTDPVRQCGLSGFTQGMEGHIECLEALGFSPACATIWYYNTVNTRTQCLTLCLKHLNDPYLDAEGQLNPCLACDEEESGPIFKALSGRTRRNSGLPSAICRPCDSVSPLTHPYLD